MGSAYQNGCYITDMQNLFSGRFAKAWAVS